MSQTVSPLTEEEMTEFQEVFKMFDKDGDGRITIKELGIVMRSLGQTPTEAEIKQMILDADIDGNGCIDFHEFTVMMIKRIMCHVSPEETKTTFKIFDKNSDGVLSADDLRHAMRGLGENMTDEEINVMIEDADTNGDGVINYQDFVAMMQK